MDKDSQMETDKITFRGGHIRLGNKAKMSEYEPETFITFEIPAIVEDNAITLEIWMRVTLIGIEGGYGILGGAYVADNTGLFKVKIGVTEEPETQKVDHIGLNGEFAQVVAEQLQQLSIQYGNFRSGTFVINRAAYHEVDSSKFAFRLLASGIASLLQNGGNIPTQADAKDWFDKIRDDIRKSG
jgi:hypothetical protein